MKSFLLPAMLGALISCNEGSTSITSPTSENSLPDSDTSDFDDTVAAYYALNQDNGLPSKSKGKVSKGSLENGKLIPFSGNNFRYFDTLSYLSERAFLNGNILKAVLSTYSKMEAECAGRSFCIMECSNKHGGKMSPHRTHQNGLSIDFMVPLLKNGQPFYELDELGRAHYLLEFDDAGRYSNDSTVVIDFNLIAQHLLVLDEQAKSEGYKISKVILKMELKDELFATEYGKKLKASGIYITKNLSPIINSLHDDHYHVDFEPVN